MAQDSPELAAVEEDNGKSDSEGEPEEDEDEEQSESVGDAFFKVRDCALLVLRAHSADV